MACPCCVFCNAHFHVVSSCHFHSLVHFRILWLLPHWPCLWFVWFFHYFSNNVGWSWLDGMDILSSFVLSCLSISTLSVKLMLMYLVWGMWDAWVYDLMMLCGLVVCLLFKKNKNIYQSSLWFISPNIFVFTC